MYAWDLCEAVHAWDLGAAVYAWELVADSIHRSYQHVLQVLTPLVMPATLPSGFPDLLQKGNGFEAAQEILVDMSLLSRTEFYIGLYMSTVSRFVRAIAHARGHGVASFASDPDNINSSSKYGVIYLGKEELWRSPLSTSLSSEDLATLGVSSGSRVPKLCTT
jgi:hypothetical protein